MLLGNYNVFNKNPGHAVGGPTDPTLRHKLGSWMMFYHGDSNVAGETNKSAFNNGYIPPYSYVLSPKAGGLSTFYQLNGSGTLSASAQQGINLLSDMIGEGTLVSNLSLVVSLVSSMAGIGGLSASMVGTINMSASLIGSGDMEGGLSLLANCIANMTGTGSVTSALRGDMYMSADIYVSQAEASVQEMVYAVWNAIASSFNESGTMGNKLNGAGSAGDPWSTDLDSYTTAGTAGKKLKELKNPSLLIDGELIV